MKFRVCLETLGKKFILEVDLGINFVKALLKKLKNCIKNRESKKVTNILLELHDTFSCKQGFTKSLSSCDKKIK